MPAYSIIYNQGYPFDSGVAFSAPTQDEALLKFNEWAKQRSINFELKSVTQFDSFNQSIFDSFECGEASTIGD